MTLCKSATELALATIYLNTHSLDEVENKRKQLRISDEVNNNAKKGVDVRCRPAIEANMEFTRICLNLFR